MQHKKQNSCLLIALLMLCSVCFAGGPEISPPHSWFYLSAQGGYGWLATNHANLTPSLSGVPVFTAFAVYKAHRGATGRASIGFNATKNIGFEAGYDMFFNPRLAYQEIVPATLGLYNATADFKISAVDLLFVGNIPFTRQWWLVMKGGVAYMTMDRDFFQVASIPSFHGSSNETANQFLPSASIGLSYYPNRLVDLNLSYMAIIGNQNHPVLSNHYMPTIQSILFGIGVHLP